MSLNVPVVWTNGCSLEEDHAHFISSERKSNLESSTLVFGFDYFQNLLMP